MKKLIFLLLLAITSTAYGQHRLVGGPCEGCEAIFEYGDRELTPVDTLPGFKNAEQKLKVTGTIFRPDGKTPAPDVILYIYHTDETGEYATKGDETGWARKHGYIRGWIKTDQSGKYTFYTRKPGSYGGNPAHIHPTILEPNGKYYYLNSYFFRGDPNLDEQNRGEGRGGSGIVTLRKENGMLIAERDIILGKNVPNYED